MFRERSNSINRAFDEWRYRPYLSVTFYWFFAAMIFWFSTKAIITGDTLTRRSPFVYWTDDQWHLHFKDHPVAFVGYVLFYYFCGVCMFYLGCVRYAERRR